MHFYSIFFKLLLVFCMLLLNGCSLKYGPFDFVSDKKQFFFNKIGNSEEFSIKISDFRDYELAIETQEKLFPIEVLNSKPFLWELEVTVFLDDKIIDKKKLVKGLSGTFLGEEFDYLSSISLGIIPSLKSFYIEKDFKVRVSVLEIDHRYTKEQLSINIGIRPSALK